MTVTPDTPAPGTPTDDQHDQNGCGDMDHDERVAEIKRLIAVLEDQVATDFTHNEPMKQRIRTYKKWLREIESEDGLHGFC